VRILFISVWLRGIEPGLGGADNLPWRFSFDRVADTFTSGCRRHSLGRVDFQPALTPAAELFALARARTNSMHLLGLRHQSTNRARGGIPPLLPQSAAVIGVTSIEVQAQNVGRSLLFTATTSTDASGFEEDGSIHPRRTGQIGPDHQHFGEDEADISMCRLSSAKIYRLEDSGRTGSHTSEACYPSQGKSVRVV